MQERDLIEEKTLRVKERKASERWGRTRPVGLR